MSIQRYEWHQKDKSYFYQSENYQEKREEWPVVCDARGNVIWLPLVEAICICYLERDSKEG